MMGMMRRCPGSKAFERRESRMSSTKLTMGRNTLQRACPDMSRLLVHQSHCASWCQRPSDFVAPRHSRLFLRQSCGIYVSDISCAQSSDSHPIREPRVAQICVHLVLKPHAQHFSHTISSMGWAAPGRKLLPMGPASKPCRAGYMWKLPRHSPMQSFCSVHDTKFAFVHCHPLPSAFSPDLLSKSMAGFHRRP
jgi:hypothetical protein